MRDRYFAACVFLLASAAAAPAQTSPPAGDPPAAATIPSHPSAAGEDARYTFSRVQDGYLRLDTRNGQVALCNRRQVGWACQVLPDDRIVLESEIARLQAENGKLKKELLSHGLALPSGVAAPPKAAASEPPKPPAESNLDRTIGVMSAMWNRLVEMIGNLTRDVMRKG